MPNPLGLPLGASISVQGLLGNANPQTTALSPEEEARFRQWMQSIGHTADQGYRVTPGFDGQDYDYRGYFQKYGPVALSNGQHLTDEYKLPVHPTFSNESVYFNQQTKPFAGEWKKKGNGFVFVPFDTRLKKQVKE